MFIDEASWIEKILVEIEPLKGNNIALNLGSSTDYFRRVAQPHIQSKVINPIINKGWKVLNIDMKQLDGVDVVADVCSEAFVENVPASSLVICTNLLEHVDNISLVINNLLGSVVRKGYILITVPYKYKKHLDPIDNLFRPTPCEIADLFPKGQIELINQNLIIIREKKYYLNNSKYPFWGRRRLLGYYFGFKYKVSGLLIRKK